MKHKMWSRLLSMALAVMMIASIVPNSAFAEAGSELAASSQVVTEMVEGAEEVTQQEETTGEEPAEQPAGETASDEEPVAEPSTEPAVESEQPTTEPSQAPAETAVPSEQPSAEPSAAPEGTQTPEGTEAPEGTAVPSETPAASATPAPSESPVPSETPAPSETPVPTETPETTEDLNEAEYTVSEPVTGAEGVTVTVQVPEGALPVGAELKASLVAEGSDEYNKAEQALSASDQGYHGLVAMDIHFEVDGQEVEPKKEVQVSIDAQALLPEEADPETVAVQHLKENENGEVVAVETVADTTEQTTGDVVVQEALVEEPAMDMATTFAVDGFSMFTITWTIKDNLNRNVTFNLPIELYSVNGTRLSDALTQEVSAANTGADMDVDQLVNNAGIAQITFENEVYNFSYATDRFLGQDISTWNAGLLQEKTERTKAGDDYLTWDGWFRECEYTTTYTYAVWYGEKPSSVNADNVIAVRSYTKVQPVIEKMDWGWKKHKDNGAPTYSGLSTQQDKKTICLMYTKENAPVMDRELSREKYVVDNENGTYDLNLTVSGAVGSTSDPAKVDVIMIFDESNSMVQSYVKTDEDGWITLMEQAKRAGKTLVGSLQQEQAKGTLDVRYNIVSFSGSGSGFLDSESATSGWLTTSAQAETAINKLYADGGTNYQAGLRQANNQLTSSGHRSDAETIMIFFTDGKPTFRLTPKGWTNVYGTGRGDNGGYNQDCAVEEAGKIQVDRFYAVGVEGAELEGLQEIANATQSTVHNAITTDPKNLNSIFAGIAADITQLLCDHVTITDTFSSYAQPVMESGVPAKLTLTIKDSEGNIKEGPAPSIALSKTDINEPATLTPSYAEGKVTLKFPDSYKLESGWEYIVTIQIEPTAAAYAQYQEQKEYPSTGEEGTGSSSAGQPGFPSNDMATVSYVYNDEDYMVKYPVPVIQITPGTLVIEKTISGMTEQEIAALQTQLNFDVELNDVTKNIPFEKFTEGDDGVYRYEVVGLAPNTEYEVTEQDADLSNFGYTLVADATNESGTVGKEQTVTASFSNVYVKESGDFTYTVTKKWAGAAPENWSVTVTLHARENGTEVPAAQKTAQLTAENQTYTFTGLSSKYTYTVTEEADNAIQKEVTSNTTYTGVGKPVTSCKNLDFPFSGDRIMAGSVTGHGGYFVVTKNLLTAEDKEAVVSFMQENGQGNFGQMTLENTEFVTPADFENGRYELDDGKYLTLNEDQTVLKLSAKDVWSLMYYSQIQKEMSTTFVNQVANGYLTINKVVNGGTYGDGRDMFTFKVTALSGSKKDTVWYFHVQGTGDAVTAFELPAGRYQIEELDNQAYNCDPSIKEVEIGPEDIQTEPELVQFTNTKQKSNIPTDGGGVENRFDKDSKGNIIITAKKHDEDTEVLPEENVVTD